MKVTGRTRWWIVGGVFVFIAVNVSFFTWPTEVLQLPLTLRYQPKTADVVIVLGAGARRHPSTGSGEAGEPLPPQAKERVQRGLALVVQGYAPVMILAGGLSRQSGYVEADLMSDYAIKQGAIEETIIKENQSINTWENAVNSLSIMERNNWDQALVVTSSYHTWRACAIFRKLKATVTCVAAPLYTIPTDTVYERLTDFRSVVREYGAIVHNYLQGRI